MFERYSETARRAIFFARFEASSYGQGTIEPEHLLLGIVREGGRTLPDLLGAEAPWSEWCRRLREHLGNAEPKLATSVDMSLSDRSQHVLESADREAQGAGSLEIGHLLLGVLAESGSFTAEMLREHGADAATIRKKLGPPGPDRFDVFT